MVPPPAQQFKELPLHCCIARLLKDAPSNGDRGVACQHDLVRLTGNRARLLFSKAQRIDARNFTL
jgi:hypothetical protein